MKNKPTAQDIERQELTIMIKKVLGSWWSKVEIDSLILKESLKENVSCVEYELKVSGRSNVSHLIEGSGKGIVDALYGSMSNFFKEKYISLNGIKFVSFDAHANIQSDTTKNKTGSDSPVTTTLIVENERKHRFIFERSHHSMNTATISVVVDMIEFFVNAEVAMLRLNVAWKDAVERNRQDLIAKYVSQMSEIVKITNYDLVLK